MRFDRDSERDRDREEQAGSRQLAANGAIGRLVDWSIGKNEGREEQEQGGNQGKGLLVV